jgi:RNA polymerase sigma-70 factor, ECF subfamily
MAPEPPRDRGPVSEDAFVEEAEQLRRELLAYCYRLTGSVQDAEDLVQEAMLHGWRSYARFRREATVRTWLYRIATNAFLSSTRRRRLLPSDLGPPATDVSLDAVLDGDSLWLEPLPDALVASDADPATLVIERDRLRLALTASLQRLPARQRSTLLLRVATCSASRSSVSAAAASRASPCSATLRSPGGSPPPRLARP